MKAAGGFSASGQHSGFDYSADSLLGQTGSESSMEVCTEELGKRKRCHIRATKQHNNLNQSGRNHETRVYDQQLLGNAGAQRLVALNMKLGNRLGRLDHFGPFLANLNQSGRVKTSWNGSFVSLPYVATGDDARSGLDQRSVVMQLFRHRMSDDDGAMSGNTTQAPYPGSVYDPAVPTVPSGKPHCLFPNNTSQPVNKAYMPDLTLPLPETGGVAADTVNNAFSKHTSGQVSFCAINRPDLEDMSWNLNKLKLQAPTTGATNKNIAQSFMDAVPFYVKNQHRRQSILQQNNFQATKAATLASGFDTEGVKVSPYIYKPVLKYGTISYELMNKNDTGCQIEFIVYKFKKTANLSSSASDYEDPVSNLGVSASYPLNKIFAAVGQGYINTVGDDLSTENLQGRKPLEKDIFSNPAFPLLPTLSKTVKSAQPCIEVMRNKFAMPSGSRRTMSINLPGEVYNPCSIRRTSVKEGTDAVAADTDPLKVKTLVNSTDTESGMAMGLQLLASELSICDEYSYGVVIAVNGQKQTRFFERSPKSGTLPYSCSSAFPNDVFDRTIINPNLGNWNICNVNVPGSYLSLGGQRQDLFSAYGLGWLCVDSANYPGWSAGVNEFYLQPVAGGTPAKIRCKMTFFSYVCAANNPSESWWNPASTFYTLPPGWDMTLPPQSWPWASMDNLTPGNPNNWPSVVNADAWLSKFEVIEQGCGFPDSQSQSGPYTVAGGYPRWYNSDDFTDPLNTPLQSRYTFDNINIYDIDNQMVCFHGDTVNIPGTTPIPPSIYPMGDNYGSFHVDYCASYTEHIGSCLYDTPHERSLYDCGQPQTPVLVPGEGASVLCKETSGMLMPAASAVRIANSGSVVYGSGTSYTQSSGNTVG